MPQLHRGLPCFDHEGWPRARGYNLGNVFAGDEGAGALRPEREWSFSAVEELARSVRDGFGLSDSSFDLWGHSAGAQFVHRFLLFKPEAPVRGVVAAGAGWYTLPDPDADFPYGTRHPHLAITREDLRRWTARPLTLMRGTGDRVRDYALRTTREAQAQGRDRYERAGHMLRAARAINPACTWRLVDVTGVGHEESRMAPAAQAEWAAERSNLPPPRTESDAEPAIR